MFFKKSNLLLPIMFDAKILISSIPIALILVTLYFATKKKQDNKNEESITGRKHKKDHLWLVIKEYLKLKNRIGLEIFDFYVFKRPDNKKQLHLLIKKTKALKSKKKFKEIFFFWRNNEPKKYDIEDYLDKLEEETKLLNLEQINKNKLPKTHRDNLIKKYGNNEINERRRYVIIFQTYNPKTKNIGNWEAIEAELFENDSLNNALKDTLIINKVLDYKKEIEWLGSLKLDEQKKKEKSALKNKKKIKSQAVLKKVIQKLRYSH